MKTSVLFTKSSPLSRLDEIERYKDLVKEYTISRLTLTCKGNIREQNQMKNKNSKINMLIAAAAALALMTACTDNNDTKTADITSETAAEIIETLSNTKPAEITGSEEPIELPKPLTLSEKYGLSEDNFPCIDGSTSTIPLEAGLRAMLFDIPAEDAEMMVKHTKTHTAFEGLLDGRCDMILTVPLSENQEKAAEDAGVKIERLPIAREGFVFVVNIDNPVDSLTQEQLKGIYSGKIKNWSEVGGNDAEIIAYQRNNDSGSQNHMTVFMGDTPLMDAKSELISGGMQGLLDAVAVYDNSIDSIGYSVYSYAAQMYYEQQKIKFIKVDGIKASLETMADKSYPLLSTTFMMFKQDTPADSPVRRFAEFAQSKEGLKAIEDAGYIPY